MAINNQPTIKPRTVTGIFTKYIPKVIPLAFDESMSYYECLCALLDYINKNVIPALDNNAEGLLELQTFYEELQEYVNNYFDNLDVQDEINNKLDEMAQSGQLEEILGSYIFKNLSYDNVSIIFPKSQGYVESGDCTLIKAFNKNIVIDCHRNTTKDGIEEFLRNNNAEHIDYFILSHYHDDHAGNFVSLVTDNFIDENTHVYLPAYSHLIDESQSIKSYYDDVHNIITSENIPYSIPNENDTLIVDDLKITFYNCQTSIFNQYAYTDYNDCSTVCLLEYGNIKGLFTGDISNKPFIRFNELNYFNYHIDFYKLEHHGINYQYENTIHFLRKITPNFAFQSGELNDFLNNVLTQGTSTSFLKHEKCRLLTSYENENDIIFNVSKYQLSLKQGKENISQSNRPAIINLYVDSTYTGDVFLGTQNKPFKDLPQCFAKISNNPEVRYIINLADGTYSNGVLTSYASKISGFIDIELKGNQSDNTKVIIKNGIQMFNGAQLVISYCTLDTEAQLYVKNSSLVLTRCVVDGNETTSSKTKTLCWSSNSNLFIDNCTFKNGQIGISGHYDKIYANNNEFNNLTTAIQNQYGTIQLQNNTYIDVTNETNLFNNAKNQSENTLYRDLIYSGNAQNGVVQLTKSIQSFKLLILTFGAVSTGQLTSAICLPFKDENFNKGSTYQVPFVSTIGGTATAGVLKFQVDSNDATLLHITQCDNIPLRTIYGVNLVNKNS